MSASASPEQDESAVIFGLTGGMGSGKSTVGHELRDLGAAVIDADEVVRQLSLPGELGFLAMVGILGEGIVNGDGHLDKRQIAEVIFSDEVLRTEVEDVIHPLVWDGMFKAVRELDGEDIAVLEVPLLKPENTSTMSGVIAVNTPVELAIERLKARGFTPDQARERISTQMSNEERVAMADFVITNDGSLSDLRVATARAWQWMHAQRP